MKEQSGSTYRETTHPTCDRAASKFMLQGFLCLEVSVEETNSTNGARDIAISIRWSLANAPTTKTAQPNTSTTTTQLLTLTRVGILEYRPAL